MSRSRRGLTIWEVLTGALFAGLCAAWCAPRIERLIWRSQRAEVGYVLESLQIHAHEAGMPSFGAMPRAPSAVSPAAVGWSGGPEGWTPPVPVARGVYFTEQGRFVGVCDVDGDGVPARYVAGPSGPITRETGPDVF
jgi:hypothetical protein